MRTKKKKKEEKKPGEGAPTVDLDNEVAVEFARLWVIELCPDHDE